MVERMDIPRRDVVVDDKCTRNSKPLQSRAAWLSAFRGEDSMAYTDKLFLALFVILFVTAACLKDRPAVKEWLIIGFSLLIILSWGAASLLIFLIIAALNYGAAHLIARNPDRKFLIAAITANVLALAAFKYYDFFRSNIGTVVDATLPVFSLGIPLAISFYTFHIISYLVDLQARKTTLARPRGYIFYLSFFPHVIAGPIVRPWQLLPQIGRIRISTGDKVIGLHHLAVGMFLKAVVANNLAALIDPIWEGSATFAPSSADRLVVAFFYYCQIYADFAGYTLMALGMARLLGYRLPPNFRQPMFASSLGEFWTRWHVTLSRWLRDYLYKPLGGNRGSRSQTLANLMITMFLGGLWHGAGWGFVVWGLMHGFGLAVERALGLRRPTGFVRPVWWFVTQLWVTLAWIFFRDPDLASASAYFSALVPTEADSLTIHSELWVGFVFAAAAILQQVVQVVVEILAASTVFALTFDLLVFSPAKVFIYFKF
jgi:D-alanyl-lipoteichoic acid acyltransferase DltB (MBOAT superfamily)